MPRLIGPLLSIGVLLGFAGVASAQDDRKALNGTACQARVAKEGKKFQYVGGALFNGEKRKSRDVVCTLIRDNVKTNTATEVDNMQVYVEQSADRRSDISCTVVARSLTTGDELASRSATSTITGRDTLSLGSLSYNGADEAIAFYLECSLPALSYIHGIVVEEDDPTDGEPEV